MALIDQLTNIRYWVLAGLLFGLAVGDIGGLGPAVIILALIIMMTISLSGLELKAKDVSGNKKNIVLALICCYIISTGALLISGRFFEGLWYGWVMIAAVPCAVSVVSSTLLMKGDVKLALVAVTVIYLAALLLTPMFTNIFIGSAVGPLEILKYVALFILIPILLSFPMKKVNIPVRFRNVVINVCFFVLIFIGFGSNREFIFDEPGTTMWIAVVCMARLILIFFAIEFILRRFGVPKEIRIVMNLICVWKNTSLGMALTMLLIDQPEASLPAAILLPLEMIWLIVMIWYYQRVPPSSADVFPGSQQHCQNS